MFFVRSGYIEYNSTLNNPGQGAYYWSRSSGSNATYAFNLYFNEPNVWLSNSNSAVGNRFFGNSLRCLYAI